MVNENTPSSSQPTGKHKKMCQEILDDIAAEPFKLTKSKKCPYCGALKFQYETSKFCCSDGNIRLANNSTPDVLKELLFSATEESKLFRDCIRTINNQFAFTSLGVKCDKNLTQRNKGIYTFKIQGQISIRKFTAIFS
ncbi:RNA pyrophosphohydrolase [Striga asiatica]|uniref:RNA pyrophosphohydrolase n=1 Tax=Striga asiatica TaxID=4170 RepID=A0A5A7QV59_STRAF|nr:RNA pyrophosphohydrolase [Striga asiatica]